MTGCVVGVPVVELDGPSAPVVVVASAPVLASVPVPRVTSSDERRRLVTSAAVVSATIMDDVVVRSSPAPLDDASSDGAVGNDGREDPPGDCVPASVQSVTSDTAPSSVERSPPQEVAASDCHSSVHVVVAVSVERP